MEEFGVRGPDNPEALLPYAHAEVYIIKSDAKILIETAHCLKYIAPHQHARSGDGRIVPDTDQRIKVPTTRTRKMLMRVTGDSAQPDHDAGVLNGSIRVVELSPDYSNIFVLAQFQHRRKPLGRDHFRIIIQEKKIRTLSLLRSDV